LILRLAIAIARYCNDRHCNLRKISIRGWIMNQALYLILSLMSGIKS